MSAEANRLEQLKAKMTAAQRQNMAEIIQNELWAREQAKLTGVQPAAATAQRTSALGPEQVSGIYGDVERKLRETKIENLQQRIRKEQGMLNLRGLSRNIARMGKSAVLLGGVVCFAIGKVLLSTGIVDAAVDKHSSTTELQNVTAAVPQQVPTLVTNPVHSEQWSEPERQLLAELDSRRVDLEKRKLTLDERETELKRQESELGSRLVELKSLTTRFSEQRKERDQKHEARLEQLANVYGSMAPAEAAPLIARLDEEIGLMLLERMPEKRLGQILSSMNQDRAIDLTKRLTERKAR